MRIKSQGPKGRHSPCGALALRPFRAIAHRVIESRFGLLGSRLAPFILLSLLLSAPPLRAEVIQDVALQVYGTGPVKTVTVAGNSSRLAVAGPSVVHIYSLTTGEKIKSVTGHIGQINAASLSFDGSLLATCAGAQPNIPGDPVFDPSARVWAADTGELLWSFLHPKDVTAVALSPDASQLVTASDDFKLRRFDLASGDFLQEWTAHTGRITSLSFSPDGTKILSASEDRSGKLWNAADGSLFATLSGNAAAVNAAAFSADGARIVLGSSDFTARVYDSSDGSLIRTIFGNDNEVLSVGISPDGATVLTGGESGYAYAWSVATGGKTASLPRLGGSVASIYFSPNGSRVVIGGGYGDQAARLLTYPDFLEILRTPGHPTRITAVDFDNTGTSLLTAGRVDDFSEFRTPARVLGWESGSGRLRYSTSPAPDFNSIVDVSFAPDGESFLAAHNSDQCMLWDVPDDGVSSASLLKITNFYATSIEMVANRRVVAAYAATAFLRNIDTGELERTFSGHDGWIEDIQDGPFLARIATASDDGTARVWNAQTGEMTQLFTGISSDSTGVAFSPGGSRLAVAVSGGLLGGLWDLNSGAFLREFLLPGSGLGAASVSYAMSGADIAFACDGRGLAVTWDAATGDLRRKLRGHQGGLVEAKYSPDGSRLLTAGADGTARLWDVSQPAEAIAPPTFVVQPQSRILRAGRPYMLRAVVDGPGPIEFSWKLLGKSDFGGKIPASRDHESFVSFKQALPSDSGTWTCVASGPGGIVTSATAGISFISTPSNADFLNHNIPQIMYGGQTVWAGVAFKNTAGPSWSADQGFSLAVVEDADGLLGGASSFPIPDPALIVDPGKTVILPILVAAPATTGVYKFKIQMQEAGFGVFGEKPTITVIVGNPPNAAETWPAYD